MQEYSDVFHHYYNSEEVRLIPNMLQNYKYMNDPRSHDKLVDIFCGNDNKIIFAWLKCPEMDELYRLWCDHKL